MINNIHNLMEAHLNKIENTIILTCNFNLISYNFSSHNIDSLYLIINVHMTIRCNYVHLYLWICDRDPVCNIGTVEQHLLKTTYMCNNIACLTLPSSEQFIERSKKEWQKVIHVLFNMWTVDKYCAYSFTRQFFKEL